jgi:hypothetical protein
MGWNNLYMLKKGELLRLALLYSNYVQEYMEKNIAKTGNQCVCIAEFYDHEYHDILRAERAGIYNFSEDTWEFWHIGDD